MKNYKKIAKSREAANEKTAPNVYLEKKNRPR